MALFWSPVLATSLPSTAGRVEEAGCVGVERRTTDGRVVVAAGDPFALVICSKTAKTYLKKAFEIDLSWRMAALED
jgi:hypothetical protein